MVYIINYHLLTVYYVSGTLRTYLPSPQHPGKVSMIICLTEEEAGTQRGEVICFTFLHAC